MTDDEIREAARAIAVLMTPPGQSLEIGKWIIPAERALEAAEKVRKRARAAEYQHCGS